MSTMESEHFTQALLELLDEAFDNVQGYFLDKGTSMFETLATVTAAEASIPRGWEMRDPGSPGETCGFLPECG